MPPVTLTSLRVRFLVVVLLAVLPTGGWAFFMVAEHRRQATVAVHAHTLQLVRVIAHHHEQLIEGTRHLLLSLAHAPEAYGSDPAACSELFATLLQGYPAYANLGVIQPDGTLFCSALPLSAPINVADHRYFQRALATRAFAMGDFQMSRLTGKPVLVFAHPVLNAAEAVEVVLFVTLDLAWLTRFATAVQLPPSVTLLVVDHHGTVLAHAPDPQRWLGQSAHDVPIVTIIFAHSAQGTTTAPGLDGLPRLFAFTRLRGAPHGRDAYVSLGVPTTVVFAAAHRLLTYQLVWLGMTIVLALGATWAVGHFGLVRPVQALVGATQRLAAGDLSARAGVSYRLGELGHLAHAFDTMAAHLALRQAAALEAEEALFVEKERAQVTLNCIGDAVMCTDSAGTITFLNVVAERLTGWAWHEAAGQPLGEVLHILDATSRDTIPTLLARVIGGNRTAHLPANCTLIQRNGGEMPIEDCIAPIHNRDGQATGAVIVFRDVSTARAMALQMTHAAEHDFLTGLPNRLLLHDRVNHAITFAPRHRKKVAVLFLDVDGFKHINDSLGHPIGDKLLQSIASCLVKGVRLSDTVSRQGGDEFIVLLSEVEHAEDAAITARRLLEAVAGAHTIDQHELHVTASIGVSVYPDDGVDAETLIQNADTAMYQAKEQGRQSYQFFTPAMNVRAVERQFIEESLRRALARQEFALHYQPKIHLRTGAITGAEALLRWTHPTRGALAPAQFIPIAEDCGLIVPIGRWVLREACTQARAWVDAGLPAVTVAVNVSALEFRDKHFLDNVFAILSATGLDPRALELEVTESVLMKHAESAVSILHTLRQRGVQVALDDFGTGYSSLSYLRKFPVDALKIDQSFVQQLTTAGDDTTIVTAVISMAQSLKLRVIAEGVETREALAFLQAHHCDEAQGYYFSRPVPPQQFATLLSTACQGSGQNGV